MCMQYTVGVSCVEIKTEADNDDVDECPHYDVPSTGKFAICQNYIHSYSRA